MNIYLIRHGMTAGNRLKRYIGRTDEPLCEEGKELLAQREKLPEPERLLCSPMLRCRETAAILFPGSTPKLVEEFRECDFGDFENKNYLELADDEYYQRWVDSGAALPFPNGETREGFLKRCADAFYQEVQLLEREGVSRAAMVVHGGTIMSILARYGTPAKNYYEFSVGNGEGYLLDWNGETADYRKI
ncbi:MAG: histidine phosphatase family protein [Eubacteriales bacterium]|nr:histidine phosphatase family protein [Eubacteriales bacterium]